MIYFHQLSISSVSFADNLCNYRIPSAERNTRKTKIKTKKTKTFFNFDNKYNTHDNYFPSKK